MPKQLNHIDLGININRSKSYFHFENFKKVFKHFWQLKNVLKKINPDVVIMPNFDYAFYFLPFIHKQSKKIKEFHSSRYFEGIYRQNNSSIIKKIRYRINDYIESKYDSLVLLTPDEKKHYKSQNTIIIPNGIEINNKKASLTSKKAISAGRIAPVKGFEKLIEAWAIVAKSHPDWVLEIYGDGEDAYIKSLQKKIDLFNLQKKICLCDKTDELDNKMLEASFYIMSSHTECFPMVLLEAKTLGLPIISFDCPYGPKNIIIDKQDGLLVKNQNSNELAKAIKQLITNDELKKVFGVNAKENVKIYTQQKVMKYWINLFIE